ncbi:MAG: putative ABC transporter ATP-binding protein [Methanobacterium sp. PtaU1.Bin242]|nr:MAG: putative ABC transporter ATP-binding protein [Methanobacterium sp. PtaU1.Bin242]
MNNDVVTSLRNVVVSYREDVALRDISLEVKQGEMIGIAGPNGAGKTTLLTIINGLGQLVHGEACVLGHLMSAGQRGRDFRLSWRIAKLRKMIGYVPQGSAIDPRVPIRVKEAVMIGRYGRIGLGKRPKEMDWEIVNDLLKLVEIKHLADKPIGHLSGGEQQRVSIARALAQDPYILLLDEPTAFLDWRSRSEILQLIKQVHYQRQLTTLFVTHDPADTFDICDRVVLLKEGRLKALGSPKQVFSPENLRDVYGTTILEGNTSGISRNVDM